MAPRRHTIASGHPEVSRAAADTLAEGGNAYDAIVAAGFVSALVEPALTSLGGGGFLLAAPADGVDPVLFDFFCDTPGRGHPGGGTPHFEEVPIHFSAATQMFHIGRGSVAVPGVLAGLLHAHDKLGRLPRARVLTPAIGFARDGVELTAYQGKLLRLLEPIVMHSAGSRALYSKDGAGEALAGPGDTLWNRDLADVLEAAITGGPDVFYGGTFADRVHEEMAGGDGLLTKDNLAAYRVIERAPLEVTYRGHRILTNPPPSLGGPLIGVGLRLLDGAPLDNGDFASPAHVTTLLRAMVEVDRLRKAGVLTPDALDDEALATARRHVFTRGTTHISVADADGNLASMTTSNGEGSGFVAGGTGIMLNNMMGEDDLHPDGFHKSPAGTRVASMMAPTLVLDGDTPLLVLGSGGSKRIRTAILQVLTHVLDFGRDLREAVEHPRVHWDGEVAQVEPGFSGDVVEALREVQPVNAWTESDVYFGGVHAVAPGRSAAGDPRRGGHALVVEAE